MVTTSDALAKVGHEISRCTLCPQRLGCRRQVRGLGSERAEVMVIFPHPGREDDMTGQAGGGFDAQMFTQLLRRVGVPFSKVYITNLVKCYPGFVKGKGFLPVDAEASATCPASYLFDEIIAVNPKLIVTVGGTVTRYFDIKGGINKVSGQIHQTDIAPVLPIVSPYSLGNKGPRELTAFTTSLHLIKRFLDGDALTPPADYISEEYFYEDTEWFVPNADTSFGMDIETTYEKGMDRHEAKIWSVGYGTATGRFAQDVPKLTRGYLPGTPTFHNAKFDIEYLNDDGWDIQEWYDTILEAHLLGFGPLGLKKLMPVFTGFTLRDFKTVKGKGTLDDVKWEALDYCSEDAWGTDALHNIFMPQIEKRGLTHLYDMERKITTILRAMERKGIPIDAGRMAWMRGELEASVTKNAKIMTDAKIADDPTDDKQFAAWFWKGKKNPVRTDVSKQLSTARDVILARKGEVAEGEWPYKHTTEAQLPIVEARAEGLRAQKFITTYIEHWERANGFIHPCYNQTGTSTWRFSCSDPNLQNVPKFPELPLLQLFKAPKGWKLIAADYSQLELRILANLSNDPRMIQLYLDGADLHDERVKSLADFWVAQAITDPARQRVLAKNVNYGIPYGLGPTGLARRLDLEFEQAEVLINSVYKDFPMIVPFQEKNLAFAKKHGYVETFLGRPLYTPGIFAPFGALLKRAKNQTKNYPIQGGAAEIVKLAMIRVFDGLNKYWPDMAFLIAQIHDELLLLVRDEVATEVKDFLESAEGMLDTRHKVPYTTEAAMGETWGDLKHIDDPFVDEALTDEGE